MNFLALETSSELCSIAVSKESQIFEHKALAPQKHEQILLDWIAESLKEAELASSKLNYVAYSCGPGGFTGIRIGAAIAQGLALAHAIPIIAVPTLQVIAQGIFRELGREHVAVISDARIGQAYLGTYHLDADDIMQPIVPDRISSLDDIAVADGITIVSDFKDTSFLEKKSEVIQDFYPQARDVLFLAKRFVEIGKFPTGDDLPIYLRTEDAWKKLK